MHEELNEPYDGCHAYAPTLHLDNGSCLLFLESELDVGFRHVEDDRLALGPRG